MKKFLSKLNSFHIILLGCILGCLLVINSNHVNEKKAQIKLSKEQDALFNRIVSKRKLESNSKTDEICSRGSDSLINYYETGDLSKIDLDDGAIKCEDCGQEHMQALIDLIESLYGNDYQTDADFRKFIDGDENSDVLINNASFTIKSDHLTEFAADLGVYFNLPLSKRFAIGSKLLVGRSIMQEVDLNATVTGGKRLLDFEDFMEGADDDNVLLKAKPMPGTYTSEWDYFTLGGNNTMKFGTGISLTYAYKENYAWRLFLDYDYTRKTYTMTYNPSLFALDAISLGIGDESAKFSELLTPEDLSELTEHQSIKKNRHTFILGGSFTVSF